MKKSLKTFLKHSAKDYLNRSANPAIVRASTIYFKSIQEMQQHQKNISKNISKGKEIAFYDYGRQGSQTSIGLQKILNELEQSYHVFLTQTGFAAVALAIMSVCRPGDEILISDCVYRPTQKITSQLLNEFNVKTVWYNPNSFDDLKSKVTKKTKLIYVENPGSNSFEFQDLGKIVALAKRKKIFSAIDNTWATAYFFKPIKLGFDMSITSATKYYSGHSDDAYLIIRGLRTLDIRMEKHQKNTMEIIKWMSKQKKIAKILYPYKTSSKEYKLWKKYYSGASGLLGVIVKSKSRSSVYKFINSLELFGIGYSWGGYSSLAVYNHETEMGKRRYFKLDKNQHLIRLHIGLEDPKDIINDLNRSMKFIK